MTLPVALDTNLLVRLLTGDEPEQAGRVADLIDARSATCIWSRKNWCARRWPGIARVWTSPMPWISDQRCNPSESEPVPHPGASGNPAGTRGFVVRRCPPSRASPTKGRRCHTSGVGLRAD